MTSNRVRCYNFHSCIDKVDGVNSQIYNYTKDNIRVDDYDVVIYQKYIHDLKKAKRLSRSKKKLLVLDNCDPSDEKAISGWSKYVDLIITSNHELTNDIIKKGVKIPVETLIDSHEADSKLIKKHNKKEKIIVTWYGVGINYYLYIKPLKPILKQKYIKFKWACGENSKWNEEWGFQKGVAMELDWMEAWNDSSSWQNFIYNSDVGIVPVFDAIKSPHKILNYMAYGIPVICSPTDSHKRIIKHGENGFFASSKEDWSKYIDILRDPEIRNKVGEKARDSVLKQYSVQSQADRYLDIIMKHYNNKLSQKRFLF